MSVAPEVAYAELKDQLAEVEEALSDAGVWGSVDCETQTFAEAIEVLADYRRERDELLEALKACLSRDRTATHPWDCNFRSKPDCCWCRAQYVIRKVEGNG